MKSTIKNACLLLFLLALSLSAQEDVKLARNIVMFVVDDQGRDAGCYGNAAIRTPHLDALAKDGTRFDYAFCTTASCSASRSVILTGLHNHANGQYGHQHSYHRFHTKDSVVSLPIWLSKAGYRTARIGKYHVAPEEIYPFDQHLTGNQGGSRNPVSMAEKCQPFINKDKSRPFFLYFCTSDPHRGGGYANELPYKPNRFGNNQTYEGVKELIYDPQEVLVPDYLPDSPECRAELAQYYQSVSRIDQGLGRLIQILKEANQYENTLILYLSDNGIAFPGAKTTLYEPGMRLPLIVRSPDQSKRGIATDAMVSWTDLTPTLLDFAGIDLSRLEHNNSRGERAPYAFHGRSFLSILEKEKALEWDYVFASHTFHEITMYYPMRVIRTRQFKYTLNLAHQLPYPFASDLYEAPTWQAAVKDGMDGLYGKRRIGDYIQRPRHELYNMEADPAEIENLASNPEFERTLSNLQDRLRAFQEASGDPWVVKYKYE
ncbi:MAG: sulfatase [Limisphaerales bacterium]|nr:heparan N-sulfatase [Pedosphaera sp.]RZO67568.1 MAG: heparan N-sulfatase [Limisphaerales bacterium]HBP56339.1 heparan N-sulfatase [Verrucomicrobiales bacterium]HCZ04423.1 heparan N-sulfatase [Verrucomicrobiales bacterium]|tara:strand:- start:3185 stop:4648 length:1464 start_codon:yes stop_codon:yes gene_type:complete